MMSGVLCVILGGGRGTRLFPLTKNRSKPAMPVAGMYRLIDIPISNCINSGLNRIYVVTQFMSKSLNQHISNTYKFDMFDRGFVEILAAQQTIEDNTWYQGTADAVRQNMRYVPEEYDEVLILSGDQLYRMNFEHLIGTHRDARADVTVAVLPVEKSAISGLGIVKVDDSGRIASFTEKPKTDAESDPYRLPPGWLQHNGINAQNREYIANMGIYVFNRKFLEHVLSTPVKGKPTTDFGKDIFPNIVGDRHVHAHVFDGFWEDLGTIRSYHEVSLQLCEDKPKFEFHSTEGIIYTRARNLPPSRLSTVRLDRVRIADGCVIQKDVEISHSIVGVRSRIGQGTKIRDTVIIGADKIESDEERVKNAQQGKVDLGIGARSIIKDAIIDKDCRIGSGVVIDNAAGIQTQHADNEEAIYYIRDGIVVIPRATTIPNATRIPFVK